MYRDALKRWSPQKRSRGGEQAAIRVGKAADEQRVKCRLGWRMPCLSLHSECDGFTQSSGVMDEEEEEEERPNRVRENSRRISGNEGSKRRYTLSSLHSGVEVKAHRAGLRAAFEFWGFAGETLVGT